MAAVDSEIQKDIFDKISKNDVNGVKTIFSNYNLKPDIYDENNMTPLQHAAYRGNKDLVRFLLDQGANVNSGKHEFDYTALHFAALSGNTEVCQLLLENGAKTDAKNSVNCTPSQMAAFVGNYTCAVVINNFVPKSDIEYYTQITVPETEPKLPLHLVEPLHKFVTEINLHPVKIIINLHKSLPLYENMEKVVKVLRLMSEREMKRGFETNEILSFKFHYLAYLVNTVLEFKRSENSGKEKNDTGEKTKGKENTLRFLIRSMLVKNSDSNCGIRNSLLTECITTFPYRENTIFQQMVSTLSRKGSPSSLTVMTCAINRRKGFIDSDTSTCATCGEEKATKKCSECKSVQYCSRECQRWHWFIHKKYCGTGVKSNESEASSEKEKQEAVDAATEALVSEIQAMKAK